MANFSVIWSLGCMCYQLVVGYRYMLLNGVLNSSLLFVHRSLYLDIMDMKCLHTNILKMHLSVFTYKM
jgi:hypothetical protein